MNPLTVNFELSRSIKLSALTTAVILNDNYELKSDNLTLYDDYKKYSTNNYQYNWNTQLLNITLWDQLVKFLFPKVSEACEEVQYVWKEIHAENQRKETEGVGDAEDVEAENNDGWQKVGKRKERRGKN